jgi:hypothetical protein
MADRDANNWAFDVPLEGLVGRISCPVTADLPGEIILAIRGGREAFTAYSNGEVLAKNSHAVVIEQTGNRTVMVTSTAG